jgi:hypothetical protein
MANDTANALQTEQNIVTGTGVQSTSMGQPVTRWGDYAGMSVDPTNDCRFWFTTQWMASNGGFKWSTRVSSFDGPTCAVCSPAPAAVPLTSAVATAANQVTLNWSSVGAAYSYNIYRSARGATMPYTKITTTAVGATSYVDNAVVGGATYGYMLSAVDTSKTTGNCEGARGAASTVATFGDCTVPPTFSGVGSVTPVVGGNSCAVRVTW